jgi:hypothetical protein
VATAELTAAEVQALAALAGHHPMTVDELARSVSDAGMHLVTADVTAVVRARSSIFTSRADPPNDPIPGDTCHSGRPGE